MPVVRSAMVNLKKEYGDKKGTSVYYALENEGKIKPPSAKKKTKKGKK